MALIDPHRTFRWAGAVTRLYWRARFAEFGKRSLLYRPAWVYRPDLMAIGERVWIGPRAWLEVGEPALREDQVALRMGDGVVLRHHVTISACESIVIEDDVLIAAWASIYDADHTLGPEGNAIWYPQVTAPVRIGRGSWLGERVTVLRGSRVGRHCIVGAGSVVKGSIPDYSVALGVPARVVGETREMIERAGGAAAAPLSNSR
jgi:acetyltransferase-like isoleucine patch superfamily enzyme